MASSLLGAASSGSYGMAQYGTGLADSGVYGAMPGSGGISPPANPNQSLLTMVQVIRLLKDLSDSLDKDDKPGKPGSPKPPETGKDKERREKSRCDKLFDLLIHVISAWAGQGAMPTQPPRPVTLPNPGQVYLPQPQAPQPIQIPQMPAPIQLPTSPMPNYAMPQQPAMASLPVPTGQQAQAPQIMAVPMPTPIPIVLPVAVPYIPGANRVTPFNYGQGQQFWPQGGYGRGRSACRSCQ